MLTYRCEQGSGDCPMLKHIGVRVEGVLIATDRGRMLGISDPQILLLFRWRNGGSRRSRHTGRPILMILVQVGSLFW